MAASGLPCTYARRDLTSSGYPGRSRGTRHVAHHHQFRRRAAELPRDRATRPRRPVVLVAGFKAPATSWRYQLKPLARAGYRVIAFDRRGHGALGDRRRRAHDGPPRRRHPRPARRARARRRHARRASRWAATRSGRCVQQFGTGGIRDVVIVDQTPKMLNTADWPYGFYDYDETNVDTLLRHRHPRSRPASREVEGARAHLARAEGDGAPEGRQADVHRRPSSSC